MLQANFDHPIFELTRKLRSAAKTGRRLHLDPVEVRVLLDRDILAAITRLESQELRNACVPEIGNDTSLAVSGFTNGQTPEHGRSAGSTAEPSAEAAEALSRGARQRLLQEVRQISPRKQHSMR